jgi:hypothetical protein
MISKAAIRLEMFRYDDHVHTWAVTSRVVALGQS